MSKSDKEKGLNDVQSLWVKISPFLVFTLIVIALLVPVWSVDIYVNQDGSPHLYNSYLIGEILKGDPQISSSFQINSAPVPNLTGHWLLTLLLFLFSPTVTTKIIVSLTFAALVGAVGWLWVQTNGREGLATSFLIGGVLAFNWMWFLGFYNFTIGVIGMTFTVGLFWRWRESFNLFKAIILSILLTLVFLSHIITFGILVGGLLVLSCFVSKEKVFKTLGWVVAATLPTLPLIVAYRSVNKQSGDLLPVWRNLANPFSVSSWVSHLQAADPFQLISRKAFPFISFDSGFFAPFSPFLWFTLAVSLMVGATFYNLKRSHTAIRQRIFWLIIPFTAISFWLLGPDDFGAMHGGFLRERVLLCGLVFLIPFISLRKPAKWLIPVQTLLVLIISFQTLVTWEYAQTSDKSSRQFLAARSEIDKNEAFGSILLIDDGCRFKSVPETSVTTLLGIGKTGKVWDNYEAGYYLFPVVAKDESERHFIYQFRDTNTFVLCDSTDDIQGRINKLDSLLTSNHTKFDVMLVLGDDVRIDEMLKKWFNEKPIFQNSKIRLFRHKNS